MAWVVVTGSSSGIGRTTAEVLARAGWDVVVHFRSRRELAEETAAAVRAAGRSALLVAADFADTSAGPALVDDIFSWGIPVRAWVHNAGVDLLTGPDAELPFEDKLRLATQIDLWGTMLTCRAAGAKLRATGGAIVTVGWDQAETGMEGDSGQLFAAIKGGIMAFTRSLAKSLAPEVRVNCVAPGWIQTAWGKEASEYWQVRAKSESPLGRWGQPEDVAHAIAYLISDQASFLTGQTLAVGGGAVMR